MLTLIYGKRTGRIRDEALAALETCRDEQTSRLTGAFSRRKGELTGVLRGIGELPPEQRRVIGETANQIKTILEERIVALHTRCRRNNAPAALRLSVSTSRSLEISDPTGHYIPYCKCLTTP